MFLSIGFSVFKDFNGIYFTLQALKLYHDLSDVELLVVDTAPVACKDTENISKTVGAKYYHRPDCKGTPPAKNAVFELATGKFVLCMDCHVLLVPDAIKKLKEYLKNNPETKDIIHGPLLYDDHVNISTHFDPVWRGHMFGTWARDEQIMTKEIIEIPIQGGGLFCMRKEAWPKFNKHMKGFGAEEGYIQEKVRQNGGKAICISWLKWVHRFARPEGVPYPLALTDRIFNYLVSWTEIGWNHREIINYFNGKITQDELFKSIGEASKFIGVPVPVPVMSKDLTDGPPKIKAYVIGRETQVTEDSFKSMDWTFEKEYLAGSSLKLVLQKFIDENNEFALICKGNLRMTKSFAKLVSDWPPLKTNQAKITIFEEVDKKSFKTKHTQLSYKLAHPNELDDVSLWLISRDFAEMVLNDYTEGGEFSTICEKEKIEPFIYLFEENILKLRLQYFPLHNVEGGLSIEAVREIVWAANECYCLEISSHGLQSTVALCQRAKGVVKVCEMTEEEILNISKKINKFNLSNFIMTNISDDFQAPDDGSRVLLINYKNLSETLLNFSLVKQKDFLRVGDKLVVIHADKEVTDVYLKSTNMTLLNKSDDYMILAKK